MQRAVWPSLWVFSIVLGVLITGHGCSPKKRDNPAYCGLYDGDNCPDGGLCDKGTHTCSSGSAGAGGQGVAGGAAGEAGAGTGGTGGVGGGNPGDTGGNGTAGAGGAGAGLGGTPADGGMDAGNRCEMKAECDAKPGTPVCDTATNTCVGCVSSSDDCGGATPVCNPGTNTCVECAGSAGCSSAKPVCDSNHCVECMGDNDCHTAEKPFCGNAKMCVGCSGDGGANACKTRDLTKPVCATSGACVECDTDQNCLPTSTTPFCGPLKTCVRCDQVQSTSTCMGLNGAKPVCSMATGACVECGKDADCSPTSTTPFCSAAGACVGCSSAPGPSTCMTLASTKPNCASSGACVECRSGSDCPNAKPVCSSSNTCGACTADGDCSGRGPGVCMSHLDGRCASTSETIYVQNNASCSDSSGTSGGTSMAPFCSMQPAVAAASTRDLVVVRGTVGGATVGFATSVSIVGQSSATIVGSVNPALHITSGTTYARDLKLTAGDAVGLQADTGSTVQLDHLLVTGNTGMAADTRGGGILLDGAGFDISNTTVTNNGPGALGGTTWGGILVNNPPMGGPKSLRFVTVQNNNPVGVACTAMITGTNVLSTGNTSVEVTPACMFTSCGTAGLTCGAQP